jgi:molybdate transport system substrate-binding protein
MGKAARHLRYTAVPGALIAAMVALSAAPPARAGTVHVAVAANFTDAAREIGVLFEAATGHRAVLSFGSTGQLYTQITQAAPFEVFLAADQERPALAVDDGHAVAASRFTYATGRLALYSADPGRVTGEATLAAGDFAKIAIASPEAAPYGRAAVEAMHRLGLYAALAPKLVYGNNVAQAYQFVATGNAELGFVALSQIAAHDRGSRWIVPEELHAPIAQDAVVLERGAGNRAAAAFAAFMKGPEARAVKQKYGYGAGD